MFGKFYIAPYFDIAPYLERDGSSVAPWEIGSKIGPKYREIGQPTKGK